MKKQIHTELSDPVARKTEWTPLREAGNLRTRKLVKINDHRLEYHPTIEGICFYLFFLIGGIMGLFLVIKEPLSARFYILTAGAFAFITAGGWMLYNGTRPVAFDKDAGFFVKGKKQPPIRKSEKEAKNITQIKNIHALQIIGKYTTDGNIVKVYELNLVLKDGGRIYLTSQRKLKQARNDAALISQFLNINLWDTTT